MKTPLLCSVPCEKNIFRFHWDFQIFSSSGVLYDSSKKQISAFSYLSLTTQTMPFASKKTESRPRAFSDNNLNSNILNGKSHYKKINTQHETLNIFYGSQKKMLGYCGSNREKKTPNGIKLQMMVNTNRVERRLFKKENIMAWNISLKSGTINNNISVAPRHEIHIVNETYLYHTQMYIFFLAAYKCSFCRFDFRFYTVLYFFIVLYCKETKIFLKISIK